MAFTAEILRLDPVVVVTETRDDHRAVRLAAARVIAAAREKARNKK